MPSIENRKLAEKLVKILESGANNPDLASLYASIEKINHRLDKLEAAAEFSRNAKDIIPSPHPSFEKFRIADAVIDASAEVKACAFEPNGRPCDHCSMCSARGF
jgi:hypothetical protein